MYVRTERQLYGFYRALPQQEKQCYIIANGQNIIGRVAVWQSPVILPSDLEVWEAKEWPEELWAVPDNCLICAARGSGVTVLSGGDSDGDEVFVTLNENVVGFLDLTDAAVGALDLQVARQAVNDLEVEERKPFWRPGDGTNDYLRHLFTVSTINVRGLATAPAEKCQQALLEEPHNEALRELMLRVAFLCHAAYDCPKKYSGAYVLAAMRKQLNLTKVSARQHHRSTWASAWEMASSGLPAYTRKPWELTNLLLHHKCGRQNTRNGLTLTEEEVTTLKSALRRARFGRDLAWPSCERFWTVPGSKRNQGCAVCS